MSATRASPAGRRDRLRAALERVGLPAWFLVIDLLWIARPETVGIDARHYQRAASAWLAGGNPWAVTESGVNFAAGPHTLLFYAPTNVLPLEASVAAWMTLGLVACAWVVRRLGLPMWWLLFPPLAHGAWNGNPQTIALALLVVGATPGRVDALHRSTRALASALAVAVKLYAGIPLLWRWGHAVVAASVLLLTMPLLPWQLYLDEGLGIGIHLGTAWNGSAARFLPLVPIVVVALWVLRRRGAEWFIVPAIWPATQFYYVAMALPALVGRPLAAAALALPLVLMTPLVVLALAVVTVLDQPPTWLPPSLGDRLRGAGRALRSTRP